MGNCGLTSKRGKKLVIIQGKTSHILGRKGSVSTALKDPSSQQHILCGKIGTNRGASCL